MTTTESSKEASRIAEASSSKQAAANALEARGRFVAPIEVADPENQGSDREENEGERDKEPFSAEVSLSECPVARRLH